MDLNGMLVFVRVVQAGSFSAAARLLQMPKSTVSRKVSDLEERIGSRLIQRTTRKLGLTDAGRTYYEHSARIVTEVEEAEQAVSRMQAAPRGLLRITTPLSFARVGPILADYLLRNPDVQVQLTSTDRQVDLVEERFDVAIRVGQLTYSSLIVRGLGVHRRVVLAAPGYCKKNGTPQTPADLSKHPCLCFGAGATPNLWTLYSGSKRTEVRVSPRLTANDFDLLRAAACAGVGIACMPDFLCADDLRTGRLRRLLPEWRTAETPIQALYPTARHLSPKVVAFVDLLHEKLRFE